MGLTQDRPGNKYRQDLLGNAKAVRTGVTWLKKQNNLNANTFKSGSVKFTASKGFRFGGTKVAATQAVLA